MQPSGSREINMDVKEELRGNEQPNRTPPRPLPWVEATPGAPYFITGDGQDWTPIGQNDAVTWPDLQGAFRRKNLPSVEAYIRMLAQHGVSCMRLMLEYCHGEHRYFERPAGRFQPHRVRLWGDVFCFVQSTASASCSRLTTRSGCGCAGAGTRTR